MAERDDAARAQADPRRAVIGAALGLALAAAVSLGLARFAYALLLPPMRADLGWSYFTAGAMNAVNAAGYLAGALAMPALLARVDARRVLLAGGAAAAMLLALHAATRSDALLYLLRAATGVASAASFVGGGVLAARLAGSAAGVGSGLVLGLYYGGTGLGIVAASIGLPPLLAGDGHAARWPAGWLLLGMLAAIATLVTQRATRALHAPPQARAATAPFAWRASALALAGYFMFGLGYIGYMTFVITLLRDAGHSAASVAAFYALLGAGVVASSWLWAGLLQRARGGGALALLNGLLALATALLALWPQHTAVVFVSGALFGAVFLSVVASTTAFVRHNAAPAAWPAGIAAFTIVFALGQIVGPGWVGGVADAAGGLGRGFALSAAVLALGALLAALQRPIIRP